MKRYFFYFLTLVLIGFYGCSYDVTEKEDMDKDGTPDSEDNCPTDPYKINANVENGECACNEHLVFYNNETGELYSQQEYMAASGQKGFWCFSNTALDTDGDGVPDQEEDRSNGCKENSLKYMALNCGCDKPESADCTEEYTPGLDTDKDGTPDLQDGCPRNRCKTKSGGCGCDKPDSPLCLEIYLNREECTTTTP